MTDFASGTPSPPTERKEIEDVVIRFAGDSGDGMQVTGAQFSETTAETGHDLATFPDFPAEIRAPAGTPYGVSGFQIHFASHDVLTPGDEPDVLVAMNPAALKVNLGDLRQGGMIIVNRDAFDAGSLAKAGLDSNPLEDGSLDGFEVIDLEISTLTLRAVAEFGLSAKEALRSKNMWTLGLVFWLFDQDPGPTLRWIDAKYGTRRPEVAQANRAALEAGYNLAETMELPSGVHAYRVPRAPLAPGTYRNANGNETTAWGLVAGARLAGLDIVYGSYPITPASALLHHLARLKGFGVTTFQAEDEIAAICAAVGASYGGKLGVTATSGPGLALKGEALGLAVAVELPLVVIDVQRGGPSTGLPTKTEQSDLFQAVLGRNGDAPLAVLAPATPGECFDMAIEAVRIAVGHMTPVILLSDGYLANGAAPWAIPDLSAMKPFPVRFRTDPEGFHPFQRDPETLARAWALPGTPGLEHRIGGLERSAGSGHISYDPDNHQEMTRLRSEKIARVARDLPEARLDSGPERGALLVVGWGSTHGAIERAAERLRGERHSVSHLHVRALSPFPRGLAPILRSFDRVLVPELNGGQLAALLRARYLVDAEPLTKVAGLPFRVAELEAAMRDRLPASPDRPVPSGSSRPAPASRP